MATSCISEEKQYENPSVVLSGTPGPPIEPPQGVLRADADSVIRQLNTQIDTTIFRLLTSAKTEEEFLALRKELFPQYRNLAGAVAGIIKGDIQDIGLAELLDVCFADLQESFAKDILVFGDDDLGREECLFSLDMLRRAHFLLCQIADVPAPEDLVEHDAKLIQQTLGRMWWAQMHLRCLIFAMKTDASAPTPEVKKVIVSSFRVALLAHASIREAWALRFEQQWDQPAEFGSAQSVDGEEEELVNEAEKDYLFLLARNNSETAGSAGLH